jgi:hypothetical protein
MSFFLKKKKLRVVNYYIYYYCYSFGCVTSCLEQENYLEEIYHHVIAQLQSAPSDSASICMY